MGKTYEVSELCDMLIYQNEKGDTKVDVYFFDKDIWMSQAAIAKMYNTTPQNITMHIKNIYEDGELMKIQLVRNSYKFKLKVQGR